MSKKDETFVFATAIAGDGVPFVMLGIPRAAWELLAARIGDKAWGMDADLTKVGAPVRFSVFACDSHEDGRKRIEEVARDASITIDDRRRTDFSIADKKT